MLTAVDITCQKSKSSTGVSAILFKTSGNFHHRRDTCLSPAYTNVILSVDIASTSKLISYL